MNLNDLSITKSIGLAKTRSRKTIRKFSIFEVNFGWNRFLSIIDFCLGSTDNITVMLIPLPGNIEIDDAAVQNELKLNDELMRLVDTFLEGKKASKDAALVQQLFSYLTQNVPKVNRDRQIKKK